jgi:hypothetical protein
MGYHFGRASIKYLFCGLWNAGKAAGLKTEAVLGQRHVFQQREDDSGLDWPHDSSADLECWLAQINASWQAVCAR